MTQPTQTTGLGKVVWFLIALGVLGACGMSAGLVYLGARAITSVGDRADDQRRAEEAAAAAARSAQERKAKLERDISEHEAKIAALNRQLAAAKDDATRRALQRQLDEEMRKVPPLGNGPGNSRNKPGCKCVPGDPLCSCL
jgi:colicin import membrane protein